MEEDLQQLHMKRDRLTERFVIATGTEIDGGIFRRYGYPEIIVNMEDIKLHIPKEDLKQILDSGNDRWLNAISILVQKMMPVMPYIDVEKGSKLDRKELREYLKIGTTLPVGTPDSQVLFVLGLAEMRKNKTGRGNVQISIDHNDGHARGVYVTGDGRTQVFDPSKGDTHFRNKTVDIDGIKIGVIGEVVTV